MTLKLYHGITSVCSVKVRIGLAEMGLAYEDEVLDLQKGDQFTAEYRALNPNAVVPTLVDDGMVLGESSLILEYLDRTYNEGRLMPPGRAAEFAARHWLLRTLSIHDAINSLTFATAQRDRIHATKTPEEIAAAVAKLGDPVKRMKRQDLLDNGVSSAHVDQALITLKRCFADMDRVLAEHDWISGADFGISDVAVVSYIDRLGRLGFSEMLAAPFPSISVWLRAMQNRASYHDEVAGKIDPETAKKMQAAGQRHWPELQQRWLEPAA